jgi:PASTA domain
MKRTTTLGLLLSAGLALAGCGGGEPDASAAPATVTETVEAPAPAPVAAPATQTPSATAPTVNFPMPNMVGMNLQVAQNTLQANGVMYSVSHDLLGMRNQVLDGNWQVCNQNIPAGQQVVGDVEGQIDFGVVQLEERCP